MKFLDRITSRKQYVFIALWVVLFVLYLPAATSGFVSDFTGWLDQIRHWPFMDYINRKGFGIRSLYQFTQFSTYVLYLILGAHEWAWHILHISLQATNAYLLYTLFRNIFEDTKLKNAAVIAFGGSMLFCISPYISEVVVWEAAFHYLQGLLFIVLILNWVQRYHNTRKRSYIWWSCIVFFISTFTLEIFYLVPWFILTMALYYRIGLQYDKAVFKKVLLYFFLPMLAMFAGHLILYHAVYGEWVAHIGEKTVMTQDTSSFLCKPLKYFFHIFFLGRFLPFELRKHTYLFCETTAALTVFYTIISIASLYILFFFKKMRPEGKAQSLVFVWMWLVLALLSPTWFMDIYLLVGDRYSYAFDAFVYLFIVLAISRVPMKALRVGLLTVFVLANLRYAIQLNRYWMKSTRILNKMHHTLPPIGDKIVMILNLPQCMQGVPMITATLEGEFKLRHNLLYKPLLNNKIYDVEAYNMNTPTDGAHVQVVGNKTLRVTLNQWGTWWMYDAHGAMDYENEDYAVHVIDAGHVYEVTLKKDVQQYVVLFLNGDQWKIADWSKPRDTEQY